MSFLAWWYGEKLGDIFNYFQAFLSFLFDFFSVRICLTTLFDVWRRDRISYKNLPLSQVLQAWSLNMASRFIGAVVKSITIFSFLITAIIFIVIYLAFVLCWLFFPIVIFALLYLSLKYLL